MLTLTYAFRILSGLITADIVAACIWNPDRGEVAFWVNLCTTFGAFLVWSLLIGRRLSCGTGLNAAISFLTVVSSLLVLGAALSLVVSQRAEPKAVPVLPTLRYVNGIYLVFLWACVIRAVKSRPGHRSSSD